jgi:hypothetical protein
MVDQVSHPYKATSAVTIKRNGETMLRGFVV